MLSSQIPSFIVPGTITLLLAITAVGIFLVTKAAPKQRAKKNKVEDK